MTRRLLTIFLALILMLHQGSPALLAQTDSETFVRTANYFLLSGSTLEDEDTIQTLSTFDLIVIPVEAQVYNEDFFEEIRSLNEDIVILAYIPTVSWNHLYWNDPLHNILYAGIEDDWWLTDEDGVQKSVWANTTALNLNTDWVPYLASFVDEEVMSTGLWDGIFYDEVQDTIDWISPLDVNVDGENDSASEANLLWEERYIELFSETRALLGDDVVIITNGSSNSSFAPHVNGRMFETFPSSSDSLTDWKNSTQDYLDFENEVAYDPITVINVNTENTGDEEDYQKVRFGITTTLLGNGYFAFDYGTENHGQLWTYDEYDAFLGNAKGDPESLLDSSLSSIVSSVWERDFENGKVIVNATTSTQSIRLDGEYEKIHGTQDTSVNDGSIVSTITLASQDGIVLLRPIDELQNAVFLNGSFARIFDTEGNTKRTGFFAYENSQLGGNQVIKQDLNGDGSLEMIVAGDTYVTIYNEDGSEYAQFAPYTNTFDKGINIAIGDLESDGTIEIVTGTENGGGPHVRVFNSEGILINPGFFPYDEAFRGGVRVAVGDLNADGTREIIVAAADTGGPHVRVANKHGKIINPGFFAYDESYRGGAYVAAGDVNGDGIDEIITGPGAGLDPYVRIYDRDGNLLSEFLALDQTQQTGVNISTTDIDGDGIDEIIGFTTDVFTLSFY